MDFIATAYSFLPYIYVLVVIFASRLILYGIKKMSGDESVTTKNEVKPHKSEEWVINLVGDFMLHLYHRSLLPTDNWCVQKSLTRKEFSKFATAEQIKKLKQDGTSDIGTLLSRCGFLLSTTKGSSFFKIKYSALFEYRNRKLEELDKLKLNVVQTTNDKKSANSPLNSLKSETNISNAEDNLKTDDNEVINLLEYQGTLMQQRINSFDPTTESCCICQKDFRTKEEYEDHVQIHGNNRDFEFVTSMTKLDQPMFNISYGLCKNSPNICFKLETALENLIIENIIIVQSCSFYYVHNMRFPYKFPKNGMDSFLVDLHIFPIHVEQPVVLIFHRESSDDICIIEQHHIMRSENLSFPSSKVNLTDSYCLPRETFFKTKFDLKDYFPSVSLLDTLEDNYFLLNGINLQPDNIKDWLEMLLIIEDTDTIRQYIKLIKKNIQIRRNNARYVLRFKGKERASIENVLSDHDEVILTTRTDMYNQDDHMRLIRKNSNDIKRMADTFLGTILAVNKGCIIFKSEQQIKERVSYTVIFRPSRVNIRYQYRALELLKSRYQYIKYFLFPDYISPKTVSTTSLELYNPNINGEQLEAVRNIAEGPRCDATYMIFGPPGTGKTTTVVEAILQVLKRPNTKILVTASSNTACDEIALRLCNYLDRINRDMVRIYARSREILVETIDDKLLNISNMYNGHFYPDVNVLHKYRIVICTLSVVAKLATGGIGRDLFGNLLYTHLFIDEIAASTEIEALMAITSILKQNGGLIISGDHKQLGPILKSKRAELLGLDKSLMDRLMELNCYRVDANTGDYDRTIQTRLVRNYRSHPAIVDLYSSLYYNHSLEAHANKDEVPLCKIWHKSRNNNYPIMFHSIMNSSRLEKQSLSWYNIAELNVVMDYVKDFMYFGINGEPVKESDIGIISPYKSQYKRIQEELNLRNWFGIETGSVETFQGKEKAIIIVSFVRSNTDTLGFLDNARRLNVTISRAKSLLILIGNPKTLSRNSDLDYIIKECKRNKTFVGRLNIEIMPKKDLQEHLNKNLEKMQENLSQNMHDLCIENEDGEENAFDRSEYKSRKGFGRRVRRNRNKMETNKKKQVSDVADDDDYIEVTPKKDLQEHLNKNLEKMQENLSQNTHDLCIENEDGEENTFDRSEYKSRKGFHTLVRRNRNKMESNEKNQISDVADDDDNDIGEDYPKFTSITAFITKQSKKANDGKVSKSTGNHLSNFIKKPANIKTFTNEISKEYCNTISSGSLNNEEDNKEDKRTHFYTVDHKKSNLGNYDNHRSFLTLDKSISTARVSPIIRDISLRTSRNPDEITANIQTSTSVYKSDTIEEIQKGNNRSVYKRINTLNIYPNIRDISNDTSSSCTSSPLIPPTTSLEAQYQNKNLTSTATGKRLDSSTSSNNWRTDKADQIMAEVLQCNKPPKRDIPTTTNSFSHISSVSCEYSSLTPPTNSSTTNSQTKYKTTTVTTTSNSSDFSTISYSDKIPPFNPAYKSPHYPTTSYSDFNTNNSETPSAPLYVDDTCFEATENHFYGDGRFISKQQENKKKNKPCVIS